MLSCHGSSSRTAQGIHFKQSSFQFWEILNHFILPPCSKSKSCSLWAFCADLRQIFLLSALNCFLRSLRACSYSANLNRMCVKFNLIRFNSIAKILNDSLPLKSIIQQTLNPLKVPGAAFL